MSQCGGNTQLKIVDAGQAHKAKESAGANLLTLALLGSPTWARTRDLRINSPALYQLSYRGIEPISIGLILMVRQRASWTEAWNVRGAIGYR